MVNQFIDQLGEPEVVKILQQKAPEVTELFVGSTYSTEIIVLASALANICMRIKLHAGVFREGKQN